jgi:putative RNA 2'-phosphotransferase
MNKIEISKFLSLILRHKPDEIGLYIDEYGWAAISEIVTKSKEKGLNISVEMILEVAATSEKKRFAISEDLTRIKANQGHSYDVIHTFVKASPPIVLYHGTAKRNVSSITEKGLVKGNRHHVHLSESKNVAFEVGKRYGEPIIIEINSFLMDKEGIPFMISENNIWLVDYVAPKYLKF